MVQSVSVQVASSTVAAEVQIEGGAPNEVVLAAGTELQVRFNYRVYEESQIEDQWTFRLAAQLDDEEESITERKHHDRSLFRDDLFSHVGLDILFPAAGTFTLTFTATANLGRRDWNKGNPFETISEEAVTGTIKVVVQ